MTLLPTVRAAPPRPRTLAGTFDLVPGPGLDPVPGDAPHIWRAAASPVAFTAAGPHAAGWYRVRLRVRMADQFAVRKRGELAAEFASGPDPESVIETFEWNRGLTEDVFFHLPRPAARLRLTLHDAEAEFRLGFDLRRVAVVRALARAVRLKLHLLSAYRNFWPVARRGGVLLLKGRVREFTRKVFKGLADARTMRLEAKQASEADAAWWRRRALPRSVRDALRRECRAVSNPAPVAVLLVADPSKPDLARVAAQSAVRQVYPHWQMVIAWPADGIPVELQKVAWVDSRVKVVMGTPGTGPGSALAAALAEIGCDRVLPLPAGWELAEAALLRLAQAAAAHPVAPAVAAEWEVDGAAPARFGLIPVARLRANPTAADPLAGATTVRSEDPLGYPLEGETLLARGGWKPLRPAGRPLTLAADVRGISGWDYVAYKVLTGLHARGVALRMNPVAALAEHLLPPGVRPEAAVRAPGFPQLIIAPPFLTARFGPDRDTAVLTMWESDRVEPKLVEILNRAGLVMVPSRWAVECFRASGVTVPLEVVPLGYDPLTFHPGPAAPAAGCVFGTAGALNAGGLRKNVQRVIDLFRRAFPAEPDARLRVKITPDSRPVETYGDGRIDITRAVLPPGDLADWCRSLTAYVNGSFAEGFGLHLLETMACGRPLISTHYSGPTEFFDATVGYVVGHTVVDARNEVYAGRWADPDDADLIARMRDVYADRPEAARRGEAAAARAKAFTWRDTVRRLHTTLAKYGLLKD